MQQDPIRRWINQFPRVKRIAKSLYYCARREAPIEDYDLSEEKIRLLLGREDPVILEIGCHDGENTVWFIDGFFEATVHCFEPDPRAIEKFLRKFGDSPRVNLHPIALGAESGTMAFYQSSSRNEGEEWDASGSLMRPKNHMEKYPWVAFDDSLEVEVRKLDSVCEEAGIEQVDLIWMDVQGAERLVIAGGRRTFDNARYIVTEYNNGELYEGQPSMKEILGLLPGHRLVARYSDDLLLERIDR